MKTKIELILLGSLVVGFLFWSVPFMDRVGEKEPGASAVEATKKEPRKVVIFIKEDGIKKFYDFRKTSQTAEEIYTEISNKEFVLKENIIIKKYSRELMEKF